MTKQALCPYCSGILEKAPSRKTKCPHCSNYMYVRGGKAYTEEQLKRYDFLQPWLGLFENSYGITKEQFEKTRIELLEQFGHTATDNDTIWRVLNNQVSRFARDPDALHRVYYYMARFVRSEGRDASPYIAKMNKIVSNRLKDYIQGYEYSEFRHRFKFFHCNDEHVCFSCREATTKVYDGATAGDVTAAVSVPLHCTSEDGCRCWISPYVDPPNLEEPGGGADFLETDPPPSNNRSWWKFWRRD